jgi:cell shape-determining protein MreC
MYTSVKLVLFFILYILIIAFTMPQDTKEGFTSYFRQTVRPHVRKIKGIHEYFSTIIHTKMKSIGRMIGIY